MSGTWSRAVAREIHLNNLAGVKIKFLLRSEWNCMIRRLIVGRVSGDSVLVLNRYKGIGFYCAVGFVFQVEKCLQMHPLDFSLWFWIVALIYTKGIPPVRCQA